MWWNLWDVECFLLETSATSRTPGGCGEIKVLLVGRDFTDNLVATSLPEGWLAFVEDKWW